MKLPAEDRLLSKIKVATNGCWEWQGSTSGGGYGEIFIKKVKGRSFKSPTHRLAYEWLIGPIPKGLFIDHLCRNRLCCNPRHLEPVTNKENSLRGVSRNATNARKTHCLRGHEFTPENTYLHPQRGHRDCKECARLRRRRPS